MSGENCTATVTVVGLGTFTCGRPAASHELHEAALPSDGKWASMSWTGDGATIRQPGTRRGGA